MSQFSFGNIDESTTDGFVLASMLEQFEAAINTQHAGSTAPTYKVSGMIWRDTSASPHLIKKWDGSQWVVIGSLNIATHVYTPYWNGTAQTSLSTKVIGDGLEDSAGNLRIKLDGASLARSASGIKLPNTGVSAGTYDSANVTVDQFGRITGIEEGIAGGWQLIDFIDVSGSPNALSFNDVFIEDWSYMLELNGLRQDSGNPTLGLRFAAAGSSYETTGYRYRTDDFAATDSSNSSSRILLIPATLRAQNYFSGNIWIYNPANTSQFKDITSQIKYREHTGSTYRLGLCAGELPLTQAMASVQLLLSTGDTFHSGRLSLYGRPNA